MAISWLFAPLLFNPSGFEWQKYAFCSLYIIFYIYYIITFTFNFIIWISRTIEDFRDWTNWLFYRGGIGVKGEESSEAWWDEELSHIRTFSGRIMEAVLSLRFFIFQYGVIYKLNVQGSDTSLSITNTIKSLNYKTSPRRIFYFDRIFPTGVRILMACARSSHNPFQGPTKLKNQIFLSLLIYYSSNLKNLKLCSHVYRYSHSPRKYQSTSKLILRFVQGVAFMLAIAGIAVAISLYPLIVTDVFASILAIVPTDLCGVETGVVKDRIVEVSEVTCEII
ncbi:hypothetical protein LXL04_023486 [Taraxacum kok-saghyz]